MQRIYATYSRLISAVETKHRRYLYSQIDWSNRLICIKGARGTGKTTLLLQRLREAFPDPGQALYASLDHIWFSSHSLLDLVDYHVTHGGTHIFLDEVHKYADWAREVKNAYDSYPALHIVLTGSSLLELDNSLTADLSRRCRQYRLHGLSLREYLCFEGIADDLPVIPLADLLTRHFAIATDLSARFKVLPHFERYLSCGYFPFYREEGDGYHARLLQVVNTVIESDVPAVEKVEYDTLYKAKHLLGILAEQVPFTLNISTLTNSLQASRGNVMKLLSLLHRADLIRLVYASDGGMTSLNKPQKILFDNTNLMYALRNTPDSGTLRESFIANQLCLDHTLCMPTVGDCLVDGHILLEIGGSGKGFAQIRRVADNYVVADGIEVGMGNKIPIWMFGFLY